MSKFLKYISASTLSFALIATFFFCLSINSISTTPTSHDMSTNQTTTHVLHAQELTSATVINGSLLTLASLLFVLFFITPLFSRKLKLLLQKNTSFDNLHWRERDFFSKTKMITQSYLSLFVRSPEYIYST